jgi:iron-sulfur cluster repair protein YtfE (RIC family)
MTHTFSQTYAHDHDRLDRLFDEYKGLKPVNREEAGARFREFRRGLERHIAWEEGLLYPLWEAKTGLRDVGPTAVMRREHEQILMLLKRMAAALDEDGVPQAEDDEGLLAILAAHNWKEEAMLYPMIDQHSTAEERERVFSSMAADA